MSDLNRLTTTSFGRDYFEQHLRQGLDYSAYGDWQRKYGRWLVDSLQWNGRTVLDIGCGCGAMVAGFAESWAIPSGVDLNEYTIQLGRRKWTKGEWRTGLSWEGPLPFYEQPPLFVGDAANLHQFSDECFDGLHSHHTAEHWNPDLVPFILSEMWRVSRPGALFFCVLNTTEFAERTGRALQSEDPTSRCVRPMSWWREQLDAAGWEMCREEFRMALMSHGWSYFREYDWDWWVARKVPKRDVTSKFCVRADFDWTWHAEWVSRLQLTGKLLRKEWEHTHIARVLEERGLLQHGRRGIGFGVGREPSVAAFAAQGCELVATDIPSDKWETHGWESRLNTLGICPDQEFSLRVTIRQLNMNCIPDDLTDFDFAWSACSLDHLGTLWHSQRFILNAMNCVRPEGWCVHTAEYSLDPRAPVAGQTVYFDHSSLQRLIDILRSLGHRVERLDWNLGNRWEDNHADFDPWPGPHLKLIGDGVVATSVLLIIQRGHDQALWFPEDLTEARRLLSAHSPCEAF